jgi:hypothetical protein
MSFKNSGYTILDNTRSIVVQLDSKLSESETTSSEGMINKLKTEACRWRCFLPLILNGQPNALPGVYNRKLKFYFSRSRSFYSRNKLSYSTLHFTDNVTKNNRQAPCCLEQIMSILNQVIFFLDLMVFLFSIH